MAKYATCKRCGQDDLIWRQTNAGKWYLSEPFIWSGDMGGSRTIFPAHNCEIYLAAKADRERTERKRIDGLLATARSLRKMIAMGVEGLNASDFCPDLACDLTDGKGCDSVAHYLLNKYYPDTTTKG